ncbi:hypothetical protein KEH51_29595 [[Brevibacterium] frigoritolerans]|uniref:Uncharacterized protein n=1 Tax=Peribacillus frigoritolerans TaxID=450367 RepID=A0A941FLM9_9BACI|nr:hypothetical protein [Peribacillus frigoritolerans]
MIEALQKSRGNVTAAAKLMDIQEVHFTSGSISMVYRHACVHYVRKADL